MASAVMDTRIRGYDRTLVTPDLIGRPWFLIRHSRLDRMSMAPDFVTPDLIGGLCI